MSNLPTVVQNGITIKLKSLAEQRFKSPSLVQMPEKQFKSIVLNLMTQIYFKCGKQVTDEELALTAQGFIDELSEKRHLTVFEIEKALNDGYKNEYGEFYGLNVRTFITWVNYYEKNIRQDLISSLRPKQNEFTNEISEEEKLSIVASGVLRIWGEVMALGNLSDGDLYVYEVLYDDGFLPIDVETKKKVYEEAKEVLRFSVTGKEAVSREEKDYFNMVLKAIEKDRDALVVKEAKRISVMKFFRKLDKDETEKNKFLDHYNSQIKN